MKNLRKNPKESDKTSAVFERFPVEGNPDVIIEDQSNDKKIRNPRNKDSLHNSRKVGQIRKIQQLLNHQVSAQFQEGRY